MKTKTRKIIGNILVWGGLLAIGLVLFSLITFNMEPFGPSGVCKVNEMFNIILLASSIVALLIGGLWGMRK